MIAAAVATMVSSFALSADTSQSHVSSGLVRPLTAAALAGPEPASGVRTSHSDAPTTAMVDMINVQSAEFILSKVIGQPINPQELTDVNGTLFFSADDGVHGRELWKSDGTEVGTVMVKDIHPTGGSFPLNLTNVDGTLFFVALSADFGRELWKSDGTEAGTVMVKDINPGTANSSTNHLTNVNGTLFFAANDSVIGVELWKSDGTLDGTVVVMDINAGPASSSPSSMAGENGVAYFAANDGIHGTELWRSAGTADTTWRISDTEGFLSPGQATPRFTIINGMVFFRAYDGFSGIELWKADDTWAAMVKDIRAGENSSEPEWLRNANGTLFFAAQDGIHGRELWKSDGSPDGTVLVKDIFPGASPGLPVSSIWLTDVNGTLFFAASSGDGTGTELWKSDGTAEGTVLVKDIYPGENGSNPRTLTNVNGTLFFVARHVNNDFELWRSDGTEEGTVRVEDIWAGSLNSSSPADLTPAGGALFFGADDGGGRTLWKVAPPNQPPSIEPIATQGVVAGNLLEITPVVTDPEDDPFTLSWEGVPAGAVTNGTLSWIPSAADVGDHTITVTAAQDDNPALVDSAQFVISVLPAVTDPGADLAVSLAAEPTAVSSQTPAGLTYTAFVTNHGPDEATGVQLTVRLPGGVDFESVQPDSNVCAAKGRNVICTVGSLPSAGEFVARIVVGTKGGNTLTADASVTANEPDPDLANNSASVSVTVCRKDCQ